MERWLVPDFALLLFLDTKSALCTAQHPSSDETSRESRRTAALERVRAGLLKAKARKVNSLVRYSFASGSKQACRAAL